MAKLWEATLDDVTCDYCEAMHGTVIRDDQAWEVNPGDVHDHCRCIEVRILDGVGKKIDPGFDKRPGAIFHQPKPIEDIPMPLSTRRPLHQGPVSSEAWIIGGLLLAATDEEDEEAQRKPWIHSTAGTYSDWLRCD